MSRTDPKYNSSPVFGLAGFVLPVEEVRGFGTWFFQLKTNLLAWEIAQSGQHPATWEKKGASLYTEKNVVKYRELRSAANRLFSKISGGQRQRVGIARALYRTADVLIFDEATSGLDTDTEAAVMEAIDALSEERTILMIAHRVSTLAGCDEIFEVANCMVRVAKGLDAARQPRDD